MRVWENPNIENNAPMEIIQATVEHAEAVAKIYNYYIENSTATFETSAISAEQMRGRIAEISAEFPYIVGVENGVVAGYAYAHRWKEREAYRRTLETAVYLDPQFCGRGMGGLLLGRLVEECAKIPDAHALIACITAENSASLRLHEKFGFERVSEFGEVGYKFGRFLGVIDLELILGRKSANKY